MTCGTVAGAIAAALVAASPAAASVTIGSQIDTPASYDSPGGYCMMPCTGVNLSLPQSNTASGGLTAPMDGVIVRWRINSGSAGNPVALRVLRQGSGTSFTGAGTSETQMTVSGKSPLFDTRLPIRNDDSVGVDARNSALVWSANTPGASVVVWGFPNNFPNGLPDGQSGAGDAQSNKELLVQAVIEADADKDGFGDETQEDCPGNPDRQTAPCETGGGGNNPPPDTTAPVITGLAVTPRRFRIGQRARISGNVSEQATLTLKFRRLVPGRVRGGKCVRETARVHTGRRCTARLAVGSSVRDVDGAFSIVFNGRLAGRPRPPGRYRVRATAFDAAGNVSKPQSAGFRLRR